MHIRTEIQRHIQIRSLVLQSRNVKLNKMFKMRKRPNLQD